MTARILKGQPNTGDVLSHVTDHITSRLPGSYRAQDFAEDLVGAFQSPPASAHRLRDVLPEFRKGTIFQHEGQSRLGRMTTVKSDTADLYKFTRRFEHSEIRQQFLDLSNGDPIEAAKAFLATQGQQSRGQGYGDTAGQGRSVGAELADMLTDEAAQALSNIPDLKEALKKAEEKAGQSGPGAGNAHNDLVAHAFRLGELVSQLQLQYEPYSHKRQDREETLFPDDVDFEPLRSMHVKDLNRIAYSEYNREEDDFYYRLATKAMMQRVYFEEKPMPPRKFAMLLDVSSSMNDPLGGKYSRAEYAAASGIALLQSALAGGNEVTLLRFDTQTFPPVQGTPSDIVADLLTGKSSGGGTSINTALKAADALGVEEMILITDGDDVVSYIPKTSLVSYVCGYARNNSLEKLSRSYHTVVQPDIKGKKPRRRRA